jgi:hypothetical protein
MEGGGVMAWRHPRCGAGGVGSGGAVEIFGDMARVGRHGGEDEADSRAPLDRETREVTSSEGVNQKGKRTTAKTPPTHG